MQEKMGNVSGEMDIPRKYQKEILPVKNAVTEIKKAFDSLIRRMDTAKERLSKLENTKIETAKLKRKEYPRSLRQLQKMQHMCNENTRKRQ